MKKKFIPSRERIEVKEEDTCIFIDAAGRKRAPEISPDADVDKALREFLAKKEEEDV